MSSVPTDPRDPEYWQWKLRHDRAEALDRIEQDARIEESSRMSDGTNSLDADQRQQATNNILGFLKLRDDVPRRRLAKMASISPGVLSELLRGKYKGDVDGVIHKLEAAIDAYFRSQGAPRDGGFVKTAIAGRIFGIIKTAAKLGRMAAFTLPSGCGKTMALQAVIRMDFPSGILIEVDPGCASPLNLCRAIIKAILGGRATVERYRSRADAFNEIKRRLKDSRRLIAVDEADGLHVDSINLLRQIHDKTGCPVVMAGRPNLTRKIEKTRHNVEIGGAIIGRTPMNINLMDEVDVAGRPDRWLFSVQDVVQVLGQHKIKIDAGVARWLCALANLSAFDGERENGGLRYAVGVFTLAAVTHQGGHLTLKMVKAAATLARGRDEASLVGHQVDELLRRKAAG